MENYINATAWNNGSATNTNVIKVYYSKGQALRRKLLYIYEKEMGYYMRAKQFCASASFLDMVNVSLLLWETIGL